MENLKVKIKRLCENAVIPQYAHDTDAGLDLVATSGEGVKDGCLIYHTGIAVEIPEGYVGLVFPRSSVYKTNLDLTNCVGVIDSGYRGEITVVFRPAFFNCFPKGEKDAQKAYDILRNVKQYALGIIGHYDADTMYRIGDRIAQLIIMPYPHVEFEEVEQLSKTERGTGGYGSTGK